MGTGMLPDVERLLQEIGRVALASVPSEDWTSIELIKRRIVTYAEFDVLFHGAWRDGRFRLEFDYDHLPAWDDQPTPEEYALDFKSFPRSAESIPPWLLPILLDFKAKHALDL
jgi:hypothetical protein